MIWFFLLSSFLIKGLNHDFFVSVTTLKFSFAKVDVEIRVFKDDLEKVVGQNFEIIEKNHEKTISYFSDNLIFYSEKTAVPCFFHQIKDMGDAVLILGVVHLNGQKIKSVNNTIFIDVFQKQQNIIHIFRENSVKTFVTEGHHTRIDIF